MDIGKKIRILRSKRGMTLKELSEKSDLSIGFLSQLERGLNTIAVDSLEKLAEILEVPLAYFFHMPVKKESIILRSFEQEVFNVEEGGFIHYHLSTDLEDKNMLPRIVEILPRDEKEKIQAYKHHGEEFIYILEGILTLYVNDRRYELFPGDSVHMTSEVAHSWENYTNKKVKILAVNTPNNFRKNPENRKKDRSY